MSASTTVGNVVVITHVHPLPQGTQLCVGTQKFSKGRPLELGTVQIMIGLMVLLFGIAMAINPDTLGVYSGVFIWGALFYIIAGALTVAAGKSFNKCLVNGALGLSVVAAVASCTATILCSLDAAGLISRCYGSWNYECYPYMSQTQGVSGVLAFFHLLEVIVSVTVAGYACSATCNCNPEIMVSYCKNPVEQTPGPPPYATVVGGVSILADKPAPNS